MRADKPAVNLMNEDDLEIETAKQEELINLYLLSPTEFLIPKHQNIVIRLDGRNFAELTRERRKLWYFDTKFQDTMVDTAKHLMYKLGLDVMYTNVVSDEINLLISMDTELFERKPDEFLQIVNSAASAYLSMKLNQVAVFAGQLWSFPNFVDVARFFWWRRRQNSDQLLRELIMFNVIHKKMCTQEEAEKLIQGQSNHWLAKYLRDNFASWWTNIPEHMKHGIGINWRLSEDWENRRAEDQPEEGEMRWTLYANRMLPVESHLYFQYIRDLIVKSTKSSKKLYTL